MPTTHTPSIEALKKALALAEQIQKLETELAAIFQTTLPPPPSPRHPVSAERKARRKKRVVSAESRAKMAEVQRARWAKKNAQ